MIDPSAVVDPTLMLALTGVIGHVITNVAKRYHTQPVSVVLAVCFILAGIHTFLLGTFGDAYISGLGAGFIVILGTATTLWHFFSRPEAKKFWESKKQTE